VVGLYFTTPVLIAHVYLRNRRHGPPAVAEGPPTWTFVGAFATGTIAIALFLCSDGATGPWLTTASPLIALDADRRGDARQADHGHVDAVLRAQVGAEDDELNAISTNSLVDRLLRPANRAATRRFLAGGSGKGMVQRGRPRSARRVGTDDYASKIAVLEEHATARVRDLTRPGPVLISLARKGFGVLMPVA
jgi:hypothetical protein